MVTSKKIEWIDIAKGIGILLVVYGHCQPPLVVNKFIYAFHMPLFFFISGYLFSRRKKEFKPFLNGKIKRLLVPYFVFSILSIPIQYLRFRMGEIDSFTFREMFFGLFNLDGTVIFNRPIWFLMAMFVSLLLFYFVSRLPVAGQIISALAGAGIAIFVSAQHVRLPFGIDVALLAFIFIVIGYQSKPFISKIENSKLQSKILMLLLSVAVTFIFSQMHNRNRMGSVDIDNWLYFYIASFSGILMTLVVSWMINTSRVLRYLGVKSLAIMVNHFYVLSFFGIVLIVTGYKEFLFVNYPGMTSLLYFAVYLICMIPAIWIYDFIENAANSILYERKLPSFNATFKKV
ncbi:MAG: acyltransferase family protein [Bacteroidales bacterium]|nr:acyltransferase family protein [Bacteroidales bacterium]